MQENENIWFEYKCERSWHLSAVTLTKVQKLVHVRMKRLVFGVEFICAVTYFIVDKSTWCLNIFSPRRCTSIRIRFGNNLHLFFDDGVISKCKEHEAQNRSMLGFTLEEQQTHRGRTKPFRRTNTNELSIISAASSFIFFSRHILRTTEYLVRKLWNS